MYKKHLFSILLACVYLISPMTHAADIGAPSYQVDVTHSVDNLVSSGAVKAVQPVESVQPVGSVQSISQINKITSLNGLHKPHKPTLIVACGYDSVEHVNVFRVLGGGSIGIGRPI